jgi:hypothetical protein
MDRVVDLSRKPNTLLLACVKVPVVPTHQHPPLPWGVTVLLAGIMSCQRDEVSYGICTLVGFDCYMRKHVLYLPVTLVWNHHLRVL